MSINSYVTQNDISDLCRVCLQLPQESQYLDLTTIYDEEDNLTYGECFTICTQIDLNAGENLPHHLCKPCGLELQMCYDFLKKIEESKRVIEQCQKNAIELVTSSEQSKDLNFNAAEERYTTQIGEKVFIDDEEDQQLPEHSGEAQKCSLIEQGSEQGFVEHSNVNDEGDEVDILEMDHDEGSTHEILSIHTNNSSLVTMKEENKVNIEVNDDLQMEDYQNLETLEDEETETLQINCDENNMPIHVTKYKIIESGENEEFLEYDEEYNEEYNEEFLKEAEEEEIDEECEEEIYKVEEVTAEHLRWQENVVTVANKEHLPIAIESVEERGESVTIENSKCKINKSLVIITENSQDDVIDNEKEVLQEAADIKSKSNSTERKRHVGSYSCDYCHRVYPNYSRMKAHRRCHEIDRPKFSCSHCGRMYATKQARDCHIQTAHDKSGYSCNICNKVFAIRKSLEIHVRYHTGDFPYSCKLCDRKFAQACHLNTHINVKHNKIRFSCDYPNCGKYFTSSSSLRNHEYKHSVMPFECEYCQQGYPAKSKLRVHILRKHCIDMSSEQLENMRKFYTMRSKVNLVQFVDT